MKKALTTLSCVCALVFASPLLYADTAPASPNAMTETNAQGPYKDAKERMKNMSKEERKAKLEEAKAKWDKLSDAEKQAFREKVKDLAQRRKEHLAKRCAELQQNNGEPIYVRIYALELMQPGKEGK
ncbi:MAG: hypothetical protein JSR17_12315 [Proteobacteria bacterium]|nr:hypothetical protein [Pseudomonadota bacterium]